MAQGPESAGSDPGAERVADGDDRFRRFAENARDVVYRYRMADPPRFEYISPSCEPLTGYTVEEFYADPELGWKLIHPDDLPLLAAMLESSSQPEEPITLRWVRKDGSILYSEQSPVPVYDDEGTLIALEGIARDVTARVLAQRSLEEALEREHEVTDRLRWLHALKDTTMRAISHDLRTPLAAIRGFAETLSQNRDRLDPDQVWHLVDRIELNAVRLERVLGDLMDLDRLTHGRLPIEPAEIDLAEVARTVLAETGETQHPVEIQHGPFRVVVDPARVERIIDNLVVNALRHTTSTTPIWVRFERTDPEFHIIVEDAGPGVPQEMRSAIFDAFDRGDAGSVVAGVGLGLSVVLRFTELLGGRVEVGDRPGGGASFRVSLPAGEEPRHTSAG